MFDGLDFESLLTPEQHAARMVAPATLGDEAKQLAAGEVSLALGIARVVSLQSPAYVRDDVESDALLGLVDAARRFHSWKETPFGAYAPLRIRGQIVDGRRSRDKLAGPGRSSARVVSQLNNTKAMSLDRADDVDDSDSRTLYDRYTDDPRSAEDVALANIEAANFIENLELTQRQQIVLRRRLDGHTHEETADLLGVSSRTVDREFAAVKQAIKSKFESRLGIF